MDRCDFLPKAHHIYYYHAQHTLCAESGRSDARYRFGGQGTQYTVCLGVAIVSVGVRLTEQWTDVFCLCHVSCVIAVAGA